MSGKYPIYKPEFTQKELFYQTRWEDTLICKIEELKPQLKTQDKWKNKPDEEIESYIIQMFAKTGLVRVTAEKKAGAKVLEEGFDPRDANWKQYNAEEIIEMNKTGLKVPKDVLEWAYSQVACDVDNLAENDIQPVTEVNDAEALEGSSDINTTKQDKVDLQKYAAQVQKQEEFMQESEEQLKKDSANIENEKIQLEKEQKEAQIKMEGYKTEHDSIEQKIKNGEELTNTEMSKYKQLDSALNKENKELMVKSKDFEDELASFNSELKSMDELTMTNKTVEKKMDDALFEYNNSSKYSSKYIVIAKYNSGVSPEFSTIVNAAVSGGLGNTSSNLSVKFSNTLDRMENSVADVQSLNDESEVLTESIKTADTEDLTANLPVDNNTETKDTEQAEKSQEEETTETAENKDATTSETNNTPTEFSTKGDSTEVSEKPAENEEVNEPEMFAAADEDKKKSAVNDEQTPVSQIENEEITPTRSVSDNKNVTLAAASEDETEPKAETDNKTKSESKTETSDVKENDKVVENDVEFNELDENSDEPETTVIASNIPQSDEAQKADETPETDETQAVDSEQSDENANEEIADEGEVQKNDMQKVFDETDAEPEERGIETNRDASRRDTSFSNIETSIAASNNELEVLEQKALKHNTASISAKNATTSIGETNYVINADGGASISGQGGSLTRDNNVNETSESMVELAHTRDEAESVNNDINIQLASLNSLSDKNMSSVTTTPNAPVQPDSSNNSEPLNQISHDISNSSASETKAYRQTKNAEDTAQSVINNSTSELEKNETKNEIGHSNEEFVSKDIDDESYDEVNAETVEDTDAKQVARYSDMATPGIMEEEIQANNMAYDGLTAEIAAQDMSVAISENIQSISEEILKVEATQNLANNNAQDILNTKANEAAKSSILTYGEKVQQKDNNTEIKRKVLTSFEIKRRDQIKRGVEKVSSSAKMKH